MIFQDNALKAYLKNVYFITGTPCGGKSTVSKALAEKHHFVLYDADANFSIHQAISDAVSQPSMNRQFKNADEYFGRSVEEYAKWLIANAREQLDFVLLDLIRLSQDQIVLCDCCLTLDEVRRLTDASRVAFLIRDPANLIDEYCNRPDHQDFRDYIYSSTDVERAKLTCNSTLALINTESYNQIKSSPYFWLERNEKSTVANTVHQVERHFQWL